MHTNKINAIILAGGKNTRMLGQDKAFLEIEGRSIIARLIDKLRPNVADIIVVTNTPEKYSKFKVKIVKDEIPNKGPLMGIYSGLKASLSKYNFVVACDMPFIAEALIRFTIKNRDNYDIVIPKISGKFHPLFGIYSKECIPFIDKNIKSGILKISSIFPKLKTNFISKRQINKFDRGLLSLVNINTKDDLLRLKGLKGV